MTTALAARPSFVAGLDPAIHGVEPRRMSSGRAKRADPEEKRLRKLTPGELADEAGALKARIGAIKDEAIRRDLRRVEGDLFRLSLVPPGRQIRFDKKGLEGEYGAPFIKRWSYEIDTDWRLDVRARKA